MLLQRSGAQWKPVSLLGYGYERELQRMLKDAPELIPGCEGSAAVREFAIQGAGYVDLLCVDEAGTLTLVECKLARNAEIRRAVVGQIFAYASALEGTSYDDFARAFADRAGKPLFSAVQEVAPDKVDGKALQTAITSALERGRFRLIIAVDQITDELRAIIEYLNRHLSDSVALIALELGRVVLDQPAEILVSTTYGAEIAAEKEKGSGTARWSAAALKEAAAAIEDGAQRKLVGQLLEHAVKHGALIKGGSSPTASGGFYYTVGPKRPSVWSLYTKPEGATVVVNLASIGGASKAAGQQALAALRSSTKLDDRLPQDDDEAMSKYPSFPLDEVLSDPTAGEAIRKAVEAAITVPPSTEAPAPTEIEQGQVDNAAG